MDAPDPNEALEARREMRRRLSELAEIDRWVHHAADLDSGEIVTTPLDRPLTPQSRAERLSELGHRVDPAAFGWWPSQRLTARHLYNPSPEAWLGAQGSSWYSAVPEPNGIVWWSLPRDHPPFARFGMWFFFRVSPVGRSVASIALSGHSYENAVGSVFLHVFGTQGPGFIRVPVDGSFGQHTVDVTFVPPAAPEPLEIIMEFSTSIEEMAFEGISLGAEPPWIEPEPPIA